MPWYVWTEGRYKRMYQKMQSTFNTMYEHAVVKADKMGDHERFQDFFVKQYSFMCPDNTNHFYMCKFEENMTGWQVRMAIDETDCVAKPVKWCKFTWWSDEPEEKLAHPEGLPQPDAMELAAEHVELLEVVPPLGA